jgi:hypothetical protein
MSGSAVVVRHPLNRLFDGFTWPWSGAFEGPFPDQARSKRSRFMTLVQAAMKSCTNFAPPSAQA